MADDNSLDGVQYFQWTIYTDAFTLSVGSYPTYQNWTPIPSPPEARGLKEGFALQFAFDIAMNKSLFDKILPRTR
jgi:hypothetical protein